ncbi:MAG TPA: methylated-DNA--[protein]-cysteine S-methyltransferase [Paludibacteraceae bacterium]|nr:methylated-DNA--[protein]-cysteine S-methyltransferase [Paludibacteraceae bacterium]HOL00677.1 methylated-DNA--[protein]-cysteine S-methyltransferase [Paludibacteraceae bacterium]HPO67429.1 methylated-DNA--[protein]-cysteine S-methyltransferase [Paludibacteraceae bacterium]
MNKTQQEELFYGCQSTIFGDCCLVFTRQNILRLFFTDEREKTLQYFEQLTEKMNLKRYDEKAKELIDQIFIERKTFPLVLKGTAFQLSVWKALQTIPFGETTTYKVIAEAIGRPNAIRAVGNAVGANSIAFLIPCHRVIRSDGQLGGYRWGVERKQKMLEWEKINFKNKFIYSAIFSLNPDNYQCVCREKMARFGELVHFLPNQYL